MVHNVPCVDGSVATRHVPRAARRYVCAKERNLLLTEMAWKRVPKDESEQMARGVPRGTDRVEGDMHRLRYEEVGPARRVGRGQRGQPCHRMVPPQVPCTAALPYRLRGRGIVRGTVTQY